MSVYTKLGYSHLESTELYIQYILYLHSLALYKQLFL